MVAGLSPVAVRINLGSLDCNWQSLRGIASDGQFSCRLYELMKDCFNCFGRYWFAWPMRKVLCRTEEPRQHYDNY